MRKPLHLLLIFSLSMANCPPADSFTGTANAAPHAFWSTQALTPRDLYSRPHWAPWLTANANRLAAGAVILGASGAVLFGADWHWFWKLQAILAFSAGGFPMIALLPSSEDSEAWRRRAGEGWGRANRPLTPVENEFLNGALSFLIYPGVGIKDRQDADLMLETLLRLRVNSLQQLRRDGVLSDRTWEALQRLGTRPLDAEDYHVAAQDMLNLYTEYEEMLVSDKANGFDRAMMQELLGTHLISRTTIRIWQRTYRLYRSLALIGASLRYDNPERRIRDLRNEELVKKPGELDEENQLKRRPPFIPPTPEQIRGLVTEFEAREEILSFLIHEPENDVLFDWVTVRSQRLTIRLKGELPPGGGIAVGQEVRIRRNTDLLFVVQSYDQKKGIVELVERTGVIRDMRNIPHDRSDRLLLDATNRPAQEELLVVQQILRGLKNDGGRTLPPPFRIVLGLADPYDSSRPEIPASQIPFRSSKIPFVKLENGETQGDRSHEVDVELSLGPMRLVLTEGPAAAGKTAVNVEVATQFILPSVYGGRNVLYVAPHHKAVNVVAERLGPDIPVLRLGSDPEHFTECLSIWAGNTQIVDGEMNINWAAIHSYKEKKARLSRPGQPAGSLTLATAIAIASDPLANAVRNGRVAMEGVDFSNYDVIILDEANRATFPQLLVAIQFANPNAKIIVVGDPRQLRPYVMSTEERQLYVKAGLARRTTLTKTPMRQDLAREAVTKVQQLNSPSAFDWVKAKTAAAWIQLSTNYRQPPLLARLVSKRTYRDRVVARGWEDFTANTLRLVRMKVPEDGHYFDRQDPQTKSYTNPESVDYIVAEVARQRARRGPDFSLSKITILTPYRMQAQAGLIQEALAKAFPKEAELPVVCTGDSYEGDSNQIIIVDITRSNEKHDLGHLAEPSRINILDSRAEDEVIWIYDPRMLDSDGPGVLQDAANQWGRDALRFMERYHAKEAAPFFPSEDELQKPKNPAKIIPFSRAFPGMAGITDVNSPAWKILMEGPALIGRMRSALLSPLGHLWDIAAVLELLRHYRTAARANGEDLEVRLWREFSALASEVQDDAGRLASSWVAATGLTGLNPAQRDVIAQFSDDFLVLRGVGVLDAVRVLLTRGFKTAPAAAQRGLLLELRYWLPSLQLSALTRDALLEYAKHLIANAQGDLEALHLSDAFEIAELIEAVTSILTESDLAALNADVRDAFIGAYEISAKSLLASGADRNAPIPDALTRALGADPTPSRMIGGVTLAVEAWADGLEREFKLNPSIAHQARRWIASVLRIMHRLNMSERVAAFRNRQLEALRRHRQEEQSRQVDRWIAAAMPGADVTDAVAAWLLETTEDERRLSLRQRYAAHAIDELDRLVTHPPVLVEWYAQSDRKMTFLDDAVRMRGGLAPFDGAYRRKLSPQKLLLPPMHRWHMDALADVAQRNGLSASVEVDVKWVDIFWAILQMVGSREKKIQHLRSFLAKDNPLSADGLYSQLQTAINPGWREDFKAVLRFEQTSESQLYARSPATRAKQYSDERTYLSVGVQRAPAGGSAVLRIPLPEDMMAVPDAVWTDLKFKRIVIYCLDRAETLKALAARLHQMFPDPATSKQSIRQVMSRVTCNERHMEWVWSRSQRDYLQKLADVETPAVASTTMSEMLDIVNAADESAEEPEIVTEMPTDASYVLDYGVMPRMAIYSQIALERRIKRRTSVPADPDNRSTLHSLPLSSYELTMASLDTSEHEYPQSEDRVSPLLRRLLMVTSAKSAVLAKTTLRTLRPSGVYAAQARVDARFWPGGEYGSDREVSELRELSVPLYTDALWAWGPPATRLFNEMFAGAHQFQRAYVKLRGDSNSNWAYEEQTVTVQVSPIPEEEGSDLIWMESSRVPSVAGPKMRVVRDAMAELEVIMGEIRQLAWEMDVRRQNPSSPEASLSVPRFTRYLSEIVDGIPAGPVVFLILFPSDIRSIPLNWWLSDKFTPIRLWAVDPARTETELNQVANELMLDGLPDASLRLRSRFAAGEILIQSFNPLLLSPAILLDWVRVADSARTLEGGRDALSRAFMHYRKTKSRPGELLLPEGFPQSSASFVATLNHLPWIWILLFMALERRVMRAVGHPRDLWPVALEQATFGRIEVIPATGDKAPDPAYRWNEFAEMGRFLASHIVNGYLVSALPLVLSPQGWLLLSHTVAHMRWKDQPVEDVDTQAFRDASMVVPEHPLTWWSVVVTPIIEDYLRTLGRVRLPGDYTAYDASYSVSDGDHQHGFNWISLHLMRSLAYFKGSAPVIFLIASMAAILARALAGDGVQWAGGEALVFVGILLRWHAGHSGARWRRAAA